MAAEWKKYTPQQRLRNTVALAGQPDVVAEIRREVFFFVSAGGNFNTILKSKGLDPACFEGVVAALLACGKLPER